MIDAQSETKLIKTFLEGNQSAGDKLINYYYSKLLGVAIKVLYNHDDAQDVVQEVLYKVFAKRKIKNFRGDARLGSWMYKITVNECKTLMCKRMRNGEVSCENINLINDNYIIKNDSSENYYKNDCIKMWVKQAVNTLDEKYKLGIKEIYYSEKSYKETSKKLNLPMHTLGVRMMRGKQLLANQLESYKWQYYSGRYDWMFGVLAA